MSTHDPRKIVEDLRNHLASPDRPLLFLFGAGTSSSINIAPPPAQGVKPDYKPLVPSIKPLTERCKASAKNLGEVYEKAWQVLEAQCVEEKKQPNIENILSKIHLKIDAIGTGEKLIGLDKVQLAKLEENILKTIAAAVNLRDEIIPEKIPHHDFASWIKKANRTAPLEIFTTNYDILLERSLELAHVPLFDGFIGAHEPFFYSDAIDRPELLPISSWVRLWKIHGSVNWQIVKRLQSERVIRTQQIGSGEMILPSHRKYDESRKQPYMALLDRLDKVMNHEHSLLITCGYSFGDEHINSIIFSILENRPTAHVISLQFEDLSPDNPLIKRAERRTNLMVLGPNAGVICGRWGVWRLLQPINDPNSSFMDMAFDSNASIESEQPVGKSDSLSGKMRLGDFNWFCKLLSTMERNSNE